MPPRIGADGLTAQQRYVKRNREKINARNAARNKYNRKLEQANPGGPKSNDPYYKFLCSSDFAMYDAYDFLHGEGRLPSAVYTSIPTLESLTPQDKKIEAGAKKHANVISGKMMEGKKLLAKLTLGKEEVEEMCTTGTDMSKRSRWERVFDEIIQLTSFYGELSGLERRFRTVEHFQAMEDLDDDLRRLEELEAQEREENEPDEDATSEDST